MPTGLEYGFGSGARRRERNGAGRRAAGLRPHQRGFALVVVVWGLGLITLLGTMTIVGSRYRSRDAGDLAAIAQAAAAAESGVALGILDAMQPTPALRPPVPSPPLRCTLPDVSIVRVRVSREAGKIDLNAAPLPLLARFFAALTRDPVRSAALAQAVVAYRTRPEPGSGPGWAPPAAPDGPKHAPFLTVLELDQIEGMTPDLLAVALPHVTVVAARPEPDPDAASLELIDLLGLVRGAASTAPASTPPGPSGPVTIRAEARSPAGAIAVREALVVFGARDAPYAVSEWRRGSILPGRDWTPEPADVRPCLR